jgi:hypothetical protein
LLIYTFNYGNSDLLNSWVTMSLALHMFQCRQAHSTWRNSIQRHTHVHIWMGFELSISVVDVFFQTKLILDHSVAKYWLYTSFVLKLKYFCNKTISFVLGLCIGILKMSLLKKCHKYFGPLTLKWYNLMWSCSNSCIGHCLLTAESWVYSHGNGQGSIVANFSPTLHCLLASYCSTSSSDLAGLVRYAAVDLQCQGTQSNPASTVTKNGWLKVGS